MKSDTFFNMSFCWKDVHMRALIGFPPRSGARVFWISAMRTVVDGQSLIFVVSFISLYARA